MSTIKTNAITAVSGNSNISLTGAGTGEVLLGDTTLSGTFGVDLGSDAEGDIYYRNSSGNFVRLARGADNYVLTMNGNVPNWEAVVSPVIGQQTIWVPAAAMEPAVTTGPATSNAVEIGTSLFAARTMDFAAASDNWAYFMIQMPKSWNEGTLIFQFVWSATGQGGGNDSVVWTIAAVAHASSGLLTTAFPTPTALALQEHSATNDDVMITAESSAVTVGGSPGAEEVVLFEVARDVSEDDLDVVARLHGIKIHYTVDSGIDD